MTDISVFYNVCDLPGSSHLITKQLLRFLSSDLAEKAKTVYVAMNGNLVNFYDMAKLLEGRHNFKLVHTSATSKLMEWPGLDLLKKFCDQQEDEHYVMYWHLKGVSQLQHAGLHDWRKYLEYWTIDRWQDNVANLDLGYETCGTNLITDPFLGIDRVPRNWNHYSGNFWWARASYIKKLNPLPHPDDYKPGSNSQLTGYPIDDNKWFRFDHEAWICSGKPKAFELHRSPGGNHDLEGSYPGWHYHHLYPESNYR